MENPSTNIEDIGPEEKYEKYREKLTGWLNELGKEDMTDALKEGELIDPSQDMTGSIYILEEFFAHPSQYIDLANEDLLNDYSVWSKRTGAPDLSELKDDQAVLDHTLKSFINRSLTLIQRDFTYRQANSYEKRIKMGDESAVSSTSLDCLLDKYNDRIPAELYQKIQVIIINKLDQMGDTFSRFEGKTGFEQSIKSDIKRTLSKYISFLGKHHYDHKYLESKIEELNNY